MLLKQKIKITFPQDSLIQFTFQYYVLPLLYIAVFYAIRQHCNIMYLITFVFFFIPLADEFFEYDLRNPTKEEEKIMENQARYKFPIYVCLYCDWFLSFYLLQFLLNNEIHIFHQIAILFGASIFSATNINSSHELVHKLNNQIDLTVGTITLLKNFYMHFAIEHVWGHHKNVATPKDPATSKKGQTLYAFFIQTIVGSWISAWNIEFQRLKEMKKNKFSFRNKMIQYTIIQLGFAIYLQHTFGWWGLYYFFIMGFGGGIVLEVVNYIEHYGLLRKEISPGVYEKVSIEHSWNAPHRLTNYFLFKLQRHSDHHANPMKPYQILNSDESSPTMPQGYAACVIIALCPSLWFNIMDEVLERYKTKTITAEFEKKTRIKIQIYLFSAGCILSFLTWISNDLKH